MSKLGKRLAASGLWLTLACVAADPGARASEDAATWHYTLALEGDELALELRAPPGPALELAVDPRAAGFVSSVGLPGSPDAGWRLAASERERDVHWRFALDAAARELDEVDLAARRGRAFVGSLSAFLLHPPTARVGARFELTVALPPEQTFVCAAPDRGELAWLSGTVAYAFGALDPNEWRLDDGRDQTRDPTLVLVALAPLDVTQKTEFAHWIEGAARSVAEFAGEFPVERLTLFLAPRRAPGVGSGHALTNGVASIWIDVGATTSRAEFDADWVLVHELLHLTLPSLPRAQHWLEEGSATYFEPLLRARAGLIDEREVWRALLDDYDQGLPGPSDAGLDRTPTWGRTYYGGAIFCLLADVEIRARTENARSLADAFRAIGRELGNATHSATIDDVLAVGDRATGTRVLAELYARLGRAAEPRELESLWRRLGVERDGDGVRFDDDAPLAFVRRALVPSAR